MVLKCLEGKTEGKEEEKIFIEVDMYLIHEEIHERAGFRRPLIHCQLARVRLNYHNSLVFSSAN